MENGSVVDMVDRLQVALHIAQKGDEVERRRARERARHHLAWLKSYLGKLEEEAEQ